jgi:hypothetical protein
MTADSYSSFCSLVVVVVVEVAVARSGNGDWGVKGGGVVRWESGMGRSQVLGGGGGEL